MRLYLVRGFPGAGKSTLAWKLCKDVIEADQYFINDKGKYDFNPSLLPKAHEWCQNLTFAALSRGNDVAVANTFTQKWEMAPYYDMKGLIADLEIVEITVWVNLTAEQLAARSLHNVPVSSIERMMKRWEA